MTKFPNRTARDIHIRQLARQGLTNWQIADRVCLSYGRVRQITLGARESLHLARPATTPRGTP